jgi:hypothetical protein
MEAGGFADMQGRRNISAAFCRQDGKRLLKKAADNPGRSIDSR